jgi:hypothetical protein
LLLAACGEDTTALPAPAGGEQPLGPEPKPLYAVMSNVGSPEGDISYLATLGSLDAGNMLDLAQGIEFPGSKSLLGISGYPAVWVTSWDEPTIQRWELKEDGSFEPGPTVSFAALGVSNTGYVSETRAFTLERSAFYSSEIGSLIQWNPTTMEIIGVLPLDIPDSTAPLSLTIWGSSSAARPSPAAWRS